jgi:hypothetical protein
MTTRLVKRLEVPEPEDSSSGILFILTIILYIFVVIRIQNTI